MRRRQWVCAPDSVTGAANPTGPWGFKLVSEGGLELPVILLRIVAEKYAHGADLRLLRGAVADRRGQMPLCRCAAFAVWFALVAACARIQSDGPQALAGLSRWGTRRAPMAEPR